MVGENRARCEDKWEMEDACFARYATLNGMKEAAYVHGSG